MKALEADSFERLRWLVLREFGALPNSRVAKRLGPGDVLYCAANMALDARGVGAAGNVNSTFDNEKFCELGGEEP